MLGPLLSKPYSDLSNRNSVLDHNPMTFTSISINHSRTGASLHTRLALPEHPRAIVQINHGMAEHGGRYERFADALVEAGFGAVAHDHRGHGHTTAPGTSLGYMGARGGWEALVDEIEAVRVHVRKERPGVPLVTFGHSMGAIAALTHALRHPHSTDALALWNSGVETSALTAVFGVILKVQRAFKGSDTPSELARKATFDTWNKQFAPNRTDFDWLSRDEAEVDAYISDPLCGFPISVGMWQDVLSGVRFCADDENFKALPSDLPVHLLAGEKDPCTDGGKAVANIEARMKARGMRDVTLRLLPDTRHESLNELNRERTTQDFVAWLEERFPKG